MKFRDKVAREIMVWTLCVLASRTYSNYIGDIMELGRTEFEFAKRLEGGNTDYPSCRSI